MGAKRRLKINLEKHLEDERIDFIFKYMADKGIISQDYISKKNPDPMTGAKSI